MIGRDKRTPKGILHPHELEAMISVGGLIVSADEFCLKLLPEKVAIIGVDGVF